MPKSLKPVLLEYILTTDLDSQLIKVVIKYAKETSIKEIATIICELCTIIYVFYV